MADSGDYSPQQYSLKCFFPVLHILHIELYHRHHPQNTPATHSSHPPPAECTNAPPPPKKIRKSPSHPRRHILCLGLPWPSVPPLSPPLASTSTFHLTVSCDRPAMWDSRYCPSLLLTHFPPLHPSSSTLLLLLVPFSWPPPSSTPPPHTENDQPSLVWFDRGKFYLTFEGKFSLHQASVRANPLSFEAHLCKLLPLVSSLPSPLFSPLAIPPSPEPTPR